MRNTIKMALAAASALVAFASPALAANTLTNNEALTPCTLAYTGALACQGYYGGNIDGATVDFQQAALAELLTSPTTGTAVGGTIGPIDYSSLPLLGKTDLAGNVLSFGSTLYGQTIIGIHFGNNNDPANPANDSTAFYLYDFGTVGASSITFTPDAQGFSNAAIYETSAPVPEPATWAMMLLGFGAVGSAMSRRKKIAGTLQIA